MAHRWDGQNRRQDPHERAAHSLACMAGSLERIADSLEKIEAKTGIEAGAQAVIDKLTAELKQHTAALKKATGNNPA